MEFSQIYSAVSHYNHENSNVVSRVDEMIASLEKFRNFMDVKKFLTEEYHVEEGKKVFYITNEVPVKIVENDRLFSIDIDFENEHITYNYAKGVKND